MNSGKEGEKQQRERIPEQIWVPEIVIIAMIVFSQAGRPVRFDWQTEIFMFGKGVSKYVGA